MVEKNVRVFSLENETVNGKLFFVCITTHFQLVLFSASCKGNFWERCLFNDLVLVYNVLKKSLQL